MSVLLPAPFSPTSARISPALTERLTSSSAMVAPKRFETLSILMRDGACIASLRGGMGKYSCPCPRRGTTGNRVRLPMPPINNIFRERERLRKRRLGDQLAARVDVVGD